MHIAIIPDGNRRWAKAQGLKVWKGHEESAKNFRSIVEACAKNPDISTLTLWAFSTENWKRDPEEVKALMKLLEKGLQDERETYTELGVRLLTSGRRDRLDPQLLAKIDEIVEETEENQALTLHICLDYGGKDEIERAIVRARHAVPSDQEIDISTFLDQPNLPDIDIVIRTSGEKRTSNFCLWQTLYAEWFFIDTLFPDFTPEDLEEILSEYEERNRRYGA